jgi:hypothetical protein
MKKFTAIVLAAAFLAGASMSAIAADVYTYEAKNGNVTFDHTLHSEKMDCAKCHEGTPAKIEVTKDFAHQTCKGCHETMNAGPTRCNECHKR